MPSEPLRVIDDTGVEFVLGKRIARGGQGTVFRVEGHPGYAIKLLDRPEDLERIAAVRRLPLDGLSVAAPLTLIHTGGTGYLMPLASDMKPIREPYLPREFGARETNAAWYRQTGGLRRRLAIAANMARSVAALHERGLAYVDLNPGNVMVSDDLNRTETWLIDTDNLTSRSAPRWDILGFPGYVAPERKLRKAPPSTLATPTSSLSMCSVSWCCGIPSRGLRRTAWTAMRRESGWTAAISPMLVTRRIDRTNCRRGAFRLASSLW